MDSLVWNASALACEESRHSRLRINRLRGNDEVRHVEAEPGLVKAIKNQLKLVFYCLNAWRTVVSPSKLKKPMP
jgi:hypothetical protein